jgi:hypothetical protein
MPRPEPAGVSELLAGGPIAPRPPASRRHPHIVAVVRWLVVACIHTLAAVGLVLALLKLFFGRVEDECVGPDLASCVDDEGWVSRSYGHSDGLACTSFAKAIDNSSHELCTIATSEDGALAADACRNSCGTCGWSKFIELFVAGAPVWARNALLMALVMAGCSRVSGFERRTGLLQNLLVGPRRDGIDINKSGWLAIVGVRAGEPGERPQSTWAEVCEARALTQRQALSSAATKLLLWHWSQPIAYLLVLWGYRCYVAALGSTQRTLASVVAARELVYLASTLLGGFCCPVFLLLDPVAAWKEAPTRLEKCIRVAMYVLTPHNYSAFCLANRFRSWRRTFLALAAVQILADLASCVALAALMAGGIQEEEKQAPAALKIGYSITAFGFLLFFGPLSVITSLRGVFDRSRQRWRRAVSGVGGSVLLLAWTCIVLLFVLLAANVDVFCDAARIGIIHDPCNGHGRCHAAAQCHCEKDYGPEVTSTDEALCACYFGASQPAACGPHGQCHWADTRQSPLQKHTCDCEAGYSGNGCEHGTGCDGEPCSAHGACVPLGGNHTCHCSSGWSGTDCNHPTGCDSKPCQHGGTCTATGGSHSCKCASGWKAANCNHPTGCDGVPCGAHGTCTPNGGNYSCSCANGWTPSASGLSCELLAGFQNVASHIEGVNARRLTYVEEALPKGIWCCLATVFNSPLGESP